MATKIEVQDYEIEALYLWNMKQYAQHFFGGNLAKAEQYEQRANELKKLIEF